MSTAPAPNYNRLGDELPGWTIRIDYDPRRDDLTVTYHRDSTPKRAGVHRMEHMAPEALEDALAKCARLARTLSVRRLF